jgi:hypothetical protein
MQNTNNTETKNALGSRKRSKLANKNAGRGQQQQKKGQWDAPISLQNSSNDASSDKDSDYNVPKADEYDNDSVSYDESNNKSRAQLLEICQERDRKIKALDLELTQTKCKQRENKKQI